jgi:PilZ domain
VAAVRLGPLYSRRLIPRVETPEGLWVCWRCAGVEDVSRVCDLSVGGLFVSTPILRPLGARARIDFLVPEGQIRTEGIVQHQVPNGGLGLKFTAITDQDCPHLVALMDRISSQRASQLAARNMATFPSRSL